jgi:hypothetical protein
MKLNLKAFVLAAGIVWGGAVFLVSIANLFWPEYGVAFLELVASIYPGYTPFTGVGSVVIGTLYGILDGCIGGLIFVWLYNALAR